jgi:8-oxo-dGTP diphosphatase
MEKPDGLFCVGTKAFIRKGDEVLIINDPIKGLDFPGGKIQEGERDLVGALKREVREETSLEIEVGEPFVVWFNEYTPDHRNYPKKVFLIGYRCEYVSGDVVLSEEHDGYRWLTKENYRETDDGSEYFKALQKYFEAVK